jgi:hypothetical protein
VTRYDIDGMLTAAAKSLIDPEFHYLYDRDLGSGDYCLVVSVDLTPGGHSYSFPVRLTRHDIESARGYVHLAEIITQRLAYANTNLRQAVDKHRDAISKLQDAE